MLKRWFGTLTQRSCPSVRSSRPWLEMLEERNAPSGMGGDPDSGHGHHGPPPPPPPHGPPPPASTSDNTISSGVNAHGSFNGSTITDSFNNTINNSTIVLMPGQQSAVQGLLGFSGLLSSVMSTPQLGSLLNDEIALAVDSYLTSPAISGMLPANVVSSLRADEATLTTAISSNPLENSPLGATLGTLAYEVTLSALTSAQATI